MRREEGVVLRTEERNREIYKNGSSRCIFKQQQRSENSQTSFYNYKRRFKMLFSSSLLITFLLGSAGTAISIPVQELDITPSPINATYIHCGTGSNLTNFEDENCAKRHKEVHHVYRHELQDDGTWRTSVADKTIAEAEAEAKLSVNRTEAELDELSKRDVPCRTYVETWFTTDNWGYWYNQWKQIGQCFYCDDCSFAAQYSASVTQTWTVGLGVNLDSAIQATFGYSWGYSQGFGNEFTCNWSPGSTYGCHSVWFQPLMTYHNGWPNYQIHAYNSGACGFTTTGHVWTYANVNQFPNHDGNVNSGNWGCDSGCQGSDHRQCQYGNYGGSLWPSSN